MVEEPLAGTAGTASTKAHVDGRNRYSEPRGTTTAGQVGTGGGFYEGNPPVPSLVIAYRKEYRPLMGRSTTELPAGKYAPCFYCNAMIETMGNRTYQFGSGWFPRRKAAKGSHSATSVTYEYKFACWECIDKVKNGIPIGQMKLWES